MSPTLHLYTQQKHVSCCQMCFVFVSVAAYVHYGTGSSFYQYLQVSECHNMFRTDPIYTYKYSIATGHADMPCFTCVYAISVYLADLFPDLHHHQQTWWHNMLITIMSLQPRYNYRAYYGFAQLLRRYYNSIISKDDTGSLLMVLS